MFESDIQDKVKNSNLFEVIYKKFRILIGQVKNLSKRGCDIQTFVL